MEGNESARQLPPTHFLPFAQHCPALPAHAGHWLWQLCPHPDTLVGQSADEPELARGCLHAGLLPGTRPIRTTPSCLWAGLHLATRMGTRGRHTDDADENEERSPHLQASAEGHDKHRAARPLLRGRNSGPISLCTEHVLSPHVGFAEGRCLRGMDGERQWTHGALRLWWRTRKRENANPMGKPSLLPLLSVQLYVLALLHVELLRPAKRHSGTGRT